MKYVTMFEQLKTEGATAVYDNIEDYLDFVMRNEVQIEEIENGLLSQGLKLATRNFLDNTFMDESGEKGYWKKLLESDFQDLIINDRKKTFPDVSEEMKEVCQHKQIISAGTSGKRNEKGHYEKDFVIYCGECKNELFRISSEGREIYQWFNNKK